MEDVENLGRFSKWYEKYGNLIGRKSRLEIVSQLQTESPEMEDEMEFLLIVVNYSFDLPSHVTQSVTSILKFFEVSWSCFESDSDVGATKRKVLFGICFE